MSQETPVSTFEQVSAVTPQPDGSFTAHIDERWTVVGNPNGGYLQGIMSRAAQAMSPHPHAITASTHFLRAPHTGPTVLTVHTLREGRNASQLRVDLLQDDEIKAETTFTFADLSSAEPQPQWASADLPVVGTEFAQCPRFVPPREVFPVEILHQVSLHLDAESLAFTAGSPRGLGKLSGWLELPESEPFSPASLLLAADVFPPATFDIDMSGWVPTLELTTYVRALPAPGPVHVTFEANLIAGNRVDESCTIHDSAGTIVAQSHQLAGIRLGGK